MKNLVLANEVSKLLGESMLTDIRIKFGFSIPKDLIRPLAVRADSAIISALSEMPVETVYHLVDQYEAEMELFIEDVVLITGQTTGEVRCKICDAMDTLTDKLHAYIQTWLRVRKLNDAMETRPFAKNTRKNHHDSRQARNHRGQHFTR